MTAVGYLKTHEKSSCFGCEACVQICPHSAISMVPEEYPPQQPKDEAVLEKTRALTSSKAREEKMARQLAENAPEGLKRLMKAAAGSMRLVNEDLLRESRYMLPQSAAAHR